MFSAFLTFFIMKVVTGSSRVSRITCTNGQFRTIMILVSSGRKDRPRKVKIAPSRRFFAEIGDFYGN